MLSQKTIEILEKNDIKIYDREKYQDEFYREIEFYSNEGEDVIECIWYDGTNEGFINAFKKNADDFDADEHAKMWIEQRGTRGVPNSIRALINDAEWIKNELTKVATELQKKGR